MGKKSRNKAILAMLLTSFLFPVVGCKDNAVVQTSSSSETGNSSSTTTEEFAPMELTSNGEALQKYKIIIPSDGDKSSAYAAEILQKYLKEATDIQLPILTDVIPETENEILIGDTTRIEDEGIDFASLGEESFVTKSVGKDLVIAANKRGQIYGVYDYLEKLGYRFYAADVTKIPSKKEVFIASDANLSWTPVFTYRTEGFFGTNTRDAKNPTAAQEFAVARRLNDRYLRPLLKEEKYGGSVGYAGGEAYSVHTVRKFLPYASLAGQHPDWFAHEGDTIFVSGKDGFETDICWTNEEGMEYLYGQMLQTLARDNTTDRISLSMSDTGAYCKCETCSKEQEEYGISGWYYRAINKVARKLKVDYPNIKMDTLSYSYAKTPPEFEMEDNVIVRVCLTMCRWHTNPEECETLKKEQQRLIDWEPKAKQFQVWSYPDNWANNLVSDPTYKSLLYNTRFFAEHSTTGMEIEGFPVENGEFGDLKGYLSTCLLINPFMSDAEYEYHMNDFLEGYYGDGWESIRAFIDRTNEIIMTEMEETGYHLPEWYSYDENIPFENWYDYVSRKYDMTVIDELNEYWDEAEEMATPQQYDKVRQSRIHWTYLELYNTWDNRYKNGTDEEKAELRNRNEQLFRDMKKYGVTKRNADSNELGNIEDFTRSPARWWSK